MRITGLANVATSVPPPSELAAIDALLTATPISDCRRRIDYHGVPVVAHPDGFLAHTCAVFDSERPAPVSPELWDVLSTAEHNGCDWVLFDLDA